MTWYQRFAKRAFDVALAGTGLALCWPFIVVCAVLAARDTGLGGLYAQRRIGRHGKPFDVYKIRTMRAIERYAGDTVTVASDPRITPLGRRLRRWKLDELPQLWNVLRGDMSLVGPRPDVPGYADYLTGEARKILELRPGITGPATIKYRDEERLLALQDDPVAFNDWVIYPDKVRLNLRYLQHWSLAMDVRYILVTIGVLAPLPVLARDESLGGEISLGAEPVLHRSADAVPPPGPDGDPIVAHAAGREAALPEKANGQERANAAGTSSAARATDEKARWHGREPARRERQWAGAFPRRQAELDALHDRDEGG